MKKIKRWLKDIFDPDNDLDIFAIGEAMNDPSTRTQWLSDVLAEIKQINMEVDKRLLSGTVNEYGLLALCARRKAYRDVMEAFLSARRTVNAATQELRHNPRSSVIVDLDRVTV